MIKVGIITASDKGSKGQREDTTRLGIKELIQRIDGEIVDYKLIPDDKDLIKNALISMCDCGIDLILTNGGTGLSPRDNTPDATIEVIEKEIPGFAEAMRMKSLEKTPHALLSRAVCGVKGKSIIVNLPGSPKGAKENLEVILPAIPHGLEVLKGVSGDCAKNK